MAQIHPSALVSPRAELGRDVYIGPFCVIDGDVTIGDGCRLAAHVCIKDGTRLGTNNEIGEGAVLGGKPQHKQANSQLGELQIGHGNSIREYVTIHRGLHRDTPTRIGDANLIMVQAHVAHDCHIGNRTIIANNVMLAGHVTVEDCAYLSGAVGIHQFCRVGQFAMVGGQAHVNRDVPPFVTVDGQTTSIVGLNVIGLRRAGFSDAELQQLKQAYRIIFRSGLSWSETLQRLAEMFPHDPAARFLSFLSTGQRGFLQERRTPRGASVAFPRISADGDADNEASRSATPELRTVPLRKAG